MAGKQQHHFWKHLQNGFGVRTGSTTTVWVYSKGAEPFLKGTSNFGVERHYFGEPNSKADRAITDFENAIQGQIRELRNAEHGQTVESAFAAHLICHLETRTRFLRSELSNIMSRMLGFLESQFADASKVRELLLSYLVSHPEVLDEKLNQEFLVDDEKTTVKQLAQAFIANMSNQQAVEVFAPFQKLAMSNVKTTMQMARDAQIKAVLTQGQKTDRWRAHNEMTYSIVKSEKYGFILPDTTVAFLTASGATSFSQKKDKIVGAIVPLSSGAAIVGSTNGHPLMSTKVINRILASCAFEAFIGKELNDTYRGLRGRIGKHAQLLGDGELQKVFNYTNLRNL